MTDQELYELIFLARNQGLFYELDRFSQDQLQDILAAIEQANEEIFAHIREKNAGLQEWDEERQLAVLDELNRLSVGVKAAMADGISAIIAETAPQIYLVQSAIASLDGRIPSWNNVVLSPGRIEGLLTQPIGGYTLAEWVNSNFDQNALNAVRKDILSGALRGKGYRDLAKRIQLGLDSTYDEATTIARSFIHSVNVSAQNDLYKRNAHIVKQVKWTAALEVGISLGRGTCIRCAALDGEKYPVGDSPPCPLHPRCRCVLVPVTPTFREMGIDVDEIAEAYRPWTRRVDKQVGRGGRKILAAGFHQGDFQDFMKDFTEDDMKKFLGPTRLGFIKSGAFDLKDFVDLDTGRLIKISEMRE